MEGPKARLVGHLRGGYVTWHLTASGHGAQQANELRFIPRRGHRNVRYSNTYDLTPGPTSKAEESRRGVPPRAKNEILGSLSESAHGVGGPRVRVTGTEHFFELIQGDNLGELQYFFDYSGSNKFNQKDGPARVMIANLNIMFTGINLHGNCSHRSIIYLHVQPRLLSQAISHLTRIG